VEGEPLAVAPPEYVIVRKLEYYREGGSEKHLRDIASMLATSPQLIHQDELKRMIADRGLENPWEKARHFRA